MESNKHLIIYAVIAIICFIEAKIFSSFPIGIFFFYAPLLAIVDREKQTFASISILISGLLIISLFQGIVGFTNLEDAIFFFIFNTILLVSFRIIRRSMKFSIALLSFILFGASIDFLILYLDQIDNTLVLAYAFSNSTSWIQWFGYSGVLGGTVWILIVNLFFFKVFFYGMPLQKRLWRWRTMIMVVITIALPIAISNLMLLQLTFGPELLSQNTITDWSFLLATENPDNEVTSMMSKYGEYMGRTAVWLSLLIVLSAFVKFKTKV